MVFVLIAIVLGTFIAFGPGWFGGENRPLSVIETNEVSSAPQVEKVISNDDGSVIVRGNASFTMAPVSSSPPPAMVPESEVRSRSVPQR